MTLKKQKQVRRRVTAGPSGTVTGKPSPPPGGSRWERGSLTSKCRGDDGEVSVRRPLQRPGWGVPCRNVKLGQHPEREGLRWGTRDWAGEARLPPSAPHALSACPPHSLSTHQSLREQDTQPGGPNRAHGSAQCRQDRGKYKSAKGQQEPPFKRRPREIADDTSCSPPLGRQVSRGERQGCHGDRDGMGAGGQGRGDSVTEGREW